MQGQRIKVQQSRGGLDPGDVEAKGEERGEGAKSAPVQGMQKQTTDSAVANEGHGAIEASDEAVEPKCSRE